MKARAGLVAPEVVEPWRSVQELRRARILGLLADRPSLSIRGLHKATGAGLATVHADLQYLRDWGFLRTGTCRCCGADTYAPTVAGKRAASHGVK